MRKFLLFILTIINGIALAQEGNVLFRTTDSIVATISPTTIVNDIPECKHQIGIGLSKFVNAAFPSDSNAFLLEYRYLKTSSFGRWQYAYIVSILCNGSSRNINAFFVKQLRNFGITKRLLVILAFDKLPDH